MGKRKELEFDLTVEFVAIPPEDEAAWRAGLSLLLDLLREEKKRQQNLNAEQEDGESIPLSNSS